MASRYAQSALMEVGPNGVVLLAQTTWPAVSSTSRGLKGCALCRVVGESALSRAG